MPIHRPKLRFREILCCRFKTKYVVVHHVGRPGRYSVQTIHQWHLNKKWAGIGYHYYVRKDGEIYQGRPRNKKGSHVYVNDKLKYNSRSIGVCFEGDFNSEEMTDKQLNASIMLLSVLSLGYGNIEICRHKDLDKRTSCPGKNFPMETLLEKAEAQKQKFIDLYGNPKEVNYKFLLKLLD